MTLHMRQPLPTARIDTLVHEALSTPSEPSVYQNVVKRGLDILLVLIAAIPVLVIVAVFAFFVALDGKSPFYVQKRIGRNGRVFGMLKLRSMVHNADSLLAEHLASDPKARLEWDCYQKLRNDPRITKVGAFIRKSSIDELPQLWNVLTGDMSIVGPRPMMTSQKDIYPGTAYYALRPGITGFWQVSARNDSSFVERASFDTAYLGQMSLMTDLKTILKTVKVVALRTGH